MPAKVLAFPQTRRYDAASQSKRTQGWRVSTGDADTANNNPQLLRNRARDLVRNNPWANKIISVIVGNVVGHGILTQWRHNNKKDQQKLQQLWEQWAQGTQCDASGKENIYGLQALVMRTVAESGECFVRLRPRTRRDALAVPMQLQILEPDYLVRTQNGKTKNGNSIINGIEYNSSGQRVAYYLYQQHPGSIAWQFQSASAAYHRVDADNILHIYRQDRPGQETGVSWLAPVITTLRELDIYEDAYLKRQQIANMHAGFIETEEDINEEEEQYTNTDEPITPGTMYLMRPGRRVIFNNPPAADGYGSYTSENLRRIAAGVGITFESLTGNLSEVNFSSARMGWQEMGRNIDKWRWNLLIPGFCHGVANWFALMAGYPQAQADFTAPARMMVDPAREIPAIKDAIRCGLLSPSEAIRQQGYDPQKLLAEWAADAQLLDSLGLKLDCDPRADKATASQQPTDNSNNKGNNNA